MRHGYEDAHEARQPYLMSRPLMTLMSAPGRLLCVSFCAVALFAAPMAAAEDDPKPVTVHPGGTLSFTDPDEVVALENPNIPASRQASASVDTSTDLLQSTAFTARPMGRSATKITERYFFHIDGGGGYETLLLTQISGHLHMRGFMSVLGHGQTHAQAVMKVRDVTNSFNGPVVASYTIVRHEIDGKFAFGLGGSIGIQGGSPFIGASGGGSVSYDVSVDFALVREALHFGFPVYLQRGRTYALELVFDTATEIGGLVGTAQARFYSPGTKSLALTNVAHPDHWIDAVTTLVPHELPNINLPSRSPLLGSGSYRFPTLDLGVLGVWGGGTMPVGLDFTMNPLNRSFNNTNDILDHIGITRNIEGLVFNQLELGAKMSKEAEEITSPGVKLSQLRLSVEPDARELITGIQTTLAKRISQAVPRDEPIVPKDGHPMLAPGQTLAFAGGDGFLEVCNEDLSPIVSGICSAYFDDGRMQFIGTAIGLPAQTNSRLVQWYDFDVHEGSHEGAAVLTQISGAISMQGILVLLGLGQADVDIRMAVRDITDSGDAPGSAPIIMSHPIHSMTLDSDVSANPGSSLSVQGGVPFAGAEFSLGFEYGNTFMRRMIRHTEDFSFVAMLQRGHSYRLELEVESMARKFTGLAIINFTPDPLRHVLDPQTLFAQLRADNPKNISNLSIPRPALTGSGSVRVPEIWFLGPWNRSMNMNLDLRPLNQTFSSANAFLDFAQVPSDIDQLIEGMISNLPVDDTKSEEILDAPGIQVNHLSITMQDDIVLMLKQAQSALELGHFSMVRGDITGNGQVNAVDVQLVINAALGIDINP